MKKKKETKKKGSESGIDTELIRMYMMGAANPGTGNKAKHSNETVDLHMEQINVGKGKIPVQDVLFHQLGEFENALDNAIASGRLEMRVVHGLGKGKLKEEIYKILAKHPHVKSYENDYHSRYGYGSTIIHFY